jgi:hypothetical protein
VIATGRITQTVIPGSSQSNRDRAELVVLRRLGTVADCAKVIEFLATDLSDYVTGAVIPIDGGSVAGISGSVGRGIWWRARARPRSKPRCFLYKKYTFT